MVLNNVTKFHKILIKTIQQRADVVGCDTRTDVHTGVTLNAPANFMAYTCMQNLMKFYPFVLKLFSGNIFMPPP